MSEGEKSLCVRLPFSLYRHLKEMAGQRGKTVSELVREAIKQYLDKHGLADGCTRESIAPFVIPSKPPLVREVVETDAARGGQQRNVLSQLHELSDEELQRIAEQSDFMTLKFLARHELERRGSTCK